MISKYLQLYELAKVPHGLFHTAPPACCNMLIQKESCLSALLAIATFPIRTCIANTTLLYPDSISTHNANLTSPTVNLASSHGVQTKIHSRVQQRSEIATRLPRPLFSDDFTRNWDLIFKDWQTFPPSSATAKAISDMHAAIHNTLINSSAQTSPSKLVSFTYGGLRLTCQCAEETIPWQTFRSVIEAFLWEMMALVHAGFVGLYTVGFYFLTGSIVWSAVVIGLMVLPNVRVGFTQNIIT